MVSNYYRLNHRYPKLTAPIVLSKIDESGVDLHSILEVMYTFCATVFSLEVFGVDIFDVVNVYTATTSGIQLTNCTCLTTTI